jgi:glycosyltransferase involved in cell wall biosynthesis
MSKNEGHARCNAFGIKYLSDSPDLDYLILMDGDGEDRPEEIKLLVNKILNEPNKSVVAKRIKRSEGFLFQMLYRLHKYLTLLTTGKLIDFGNYSCLIKSDIKKLSTKSSLWSSYSGTFKKNIKNYNEINSFRGMRYFGPSQMSLFKLLVHSLSIIAVFKYRVFFSSLLFLILLYCLEILIQYNFLFLQALIMLFNIFVFVVSFRESEKELESSQLNIASVEKITH